MKNFIIPWPSQYSGDFRNMQEFLEGIGYPPVLFILNFILAHGTSDWAIRYGEIERWVNAKMDAHFSLLSQLIETGHHESVDVIREYKIYYDRMYNMISGDDIEYEEDLFETVAVLRHYYSSIVLPNLGESEHSSIVDFKDLENGFACIVFNNALGDLINDFYAFTPPNISSDNSFPFGAAANEGILGIHSTPGGATFITGC